MIKSLKNIIIIGAGGFGKEIFSYIQDDLDNITLKNTNLKGFLDDNEINFINTGLNNSLYLGKINDYKFSTNDYAIIAIGNIKIRNSIINQLINNTQFFTFIHSTSYVSKYAKIGKGIIVCPFCVIQPYSVIGDYCSLNIYCSIGHDSILGTGSVLSPYCTLNGNVKTGSNLFMGTRSTILLNNTIGNNCTISAHTLIDINIEDQYIIKSKNDKYQIKNRFLKG